MFRTTYKNNYGMLALGLVVGSVATCLLTKVVKHNDMYQKFIAHGSKDTKPNGNMGEQVNQAVEKMGKNEKKQSFEKFKNADKTDVKNTSDKMPLTD